jgi:hypothetical protein
MHGDGRVTRGVDQHAPPPNAAAHPESSEDCSPLTHIEVLVAPCDPSHPHYPGTRRDGQFHRVYPGYRHTEAQVHPARCHARRGRPGLPPVTQLQSRTLRDRATSASSGALSILDGTHVIPVGECTGSTCPTLNEEEWSERMTTDGMSQSQGLHPLVERDR